MYKMNAIYAEIVPFENASAIETSGGAYYAKGSLIKQVVDNHPYGYSSGIYAGTINAESIYYCPDVTASSNASSIPFSALEDDSYYQIAPAITQIEPREGCIEDRVHFIFPVVGSAVSGVPVQSSGINNVFGNDSDEVAHLAIWLYCVLMGKEDY